MTPGVLSTPRPAPGRFVPAAAAATVIGLSLPVFLIAGWTLEGWGLGAVLWVASQAFGLLLARLRLGMGNLAGSGVVAFGMMFRAIVVMVVILAVAVSESDVALAAALVYALAYTLELGLSFIAYFGGAPR
jgi:multisubunit Na+/H+ antiporter MnhF subunit